MVCSWNQLQRNLISSSVTEGIFKCVPLLVDCCFLESVIPVLLNRQNGLVPLLSKFQDFRKEENTVEIIKNVLEIFGHLLEQFIEAMSSHLVVIKVKF